MMLSLKRAAQDQVHVCLTIDGIRECELVKNTREAFEFEQQLSFNASRYEYLHYQRSDEAMALMARMDCICYI